MKLTPDDKKTKAAEFKWRSLLEHKYDSDPKKSSIQIEF